MAQAGLKALHQAGDGGGLVAGRLVVGHHGKIRALAQAAGAEGLAKLACVIHSRIVAGLTQPSQMPGPKRPDGCASEAIHHCDAESVRMRRFIAAGAAGLLHPCREAKPHV